LRVVAEEDFGVPHLCHLGEEAGGSPSAALDLFNPKMLGRLTTLAVSLVTPRQEINMPWWG